jgi:hypothetical protein
MRILVLALLGVVFSTAASAETVRLDRLDNATRTYIQRGLEDRDYRCFEYALKYLRGKAKPKDIYVTFDDPSQGAVSFGVGESGDSYACSKGELSNWDAGSKTVIKQLR